MRPTRRVVIAASLLALAMSHGAGAQSPMTWTYTMNVKVDSGNGRQPTSIAMRQQVNDRFLRMEIVQESGMNEAGSAEGVVTLFDGVDSTITMVMPSQKMATIMAIPSTLSAAHTMQMTRSSDATTAIEDLGVGERLLGHATGRYRMTATGNAEITFMGHTCSRPISGVSDVWIAPDVDLRPAIDAMSKRLGNPGGADAMTTQFGGVSAAMPKGTPLRMITRTTAPDQSGTPREVTTTMEIVEFNHAPTNPALFAVPDGYETMDMRKMLAKLPAGMLDSVTKAAAEKAPVDLCGGAN